MKDNPTIRKKNRDPYRKSHTTPISPFPLFPPTTTLDDNIIDNPFERHNG